MALTEIVIANMALSRCGVARALPDGDGTLANSSDGSIDEALCQRWYERCRDSCLYDHPWTFARVFTTLTLNDAGAGEAWEDEWDYAYTYPTDCIKARRFVNDVGTGYYGFGTSEHIWPGLRTDEWAFVVRRHDSTRVILTDVQEGDADLEYTQKVTDAAAYTIQFAEALAWRLAAEIVAPLSGNPEKAAQFMAYYEHYVNKAAAGEHNEENPHMPGDGSILRARTGAGPLHGYL